MSVYVDKSRHRFGRMYMCHMIADTDGELQQMADYIGVARRHCQSSASTPHYDICLSKRAFAVRAGAIECDLRTFVGHIQRLRDSRKMNARRPA